MSTTELKRDTALSVVLSFTFSTEIPFSSAIFFATWRMFRPLLLVFPPFPATDQPAVQKIRSGPRW